jgi:carbon monoxide dehydrogenase subunit G
VAKFPTEVDESITVEVPTADVYRYLWDVVGSSRCIAGLESCERVGDDTYCFLYAERSTGPISMVVRYTTRYQGNGRDAIDFQSIAASEDNTDATGAIRLQPAGPRATRITLRQTIAPDTPVPRLLQGLVRSFVEREATQAVRQYLENLKRKLEAAATR